MEKNKIRAIIVEPSKEPAVCLIENSLKELQKIVGGYIEIVGPEIINDKEIVIICNEEGKLLGLPPNREIGHDILYGTFLIAGIDDGEIRSLEDEEIEHIKEYLLC